MSNSNQICSVGRRKESSATVYLKEGSGKIIINEKSALDYFYADKFVLDKILKPLEVFNLKDKYDIFARVKGGGFSSQMESIRLAIAKSLVKLDFSNKSLLKSLSLLKKVKNSGKERKKIGKKSARKSPQWRKR